MITVEANVKDTFHKKILSREQDLIPVSFKRKLAYKGNYMEEIISKSKIVEYFNYFKRENPLFANDELNPDKIDEQIKSVSGEDCETEEVESDSENADINTDQAEAGRGGAAQCEDCEKQQVHICPVDSDVYDLYLILDSGEVPLLERFGKIFGFEFQIESFLLIIYMIVYFAIITIYLIYHLIQIIASPRYAVV